MVSPMREKRAWPPQDRDSDGETVAAFEAAVAVVKETVVRSGEVLVSAKEDLSDHQHWLKAQTAAVQADRERHDRWLQRQRERQEALERRELKRAKRRAMRQAAMHSVGSGLTFVGRGLRNFVLSVARAVWDGLLFAGRTARNLGLSAGKVLRSGFSLITAKVHALAPPVGNFLSIAFGGLAARARNASRAIGRWLVTALAWLAAKAGAVSNTADEVLAPASNAVAARAYALAPALWDKVGKAGLIARRYATEGTQRLQGLLPAAKAPWAKAPRVEAENAVFLPQPVRGIDLSQMLIIAGALLLVCGGLMLGGGLILRAKTPSSPIAEVSPSEPIAWLFRHKNFPIDERAVFAYTTTPEGVRIKGFSIGAVNMSDDPISSLGGVIKPDLHDQDLELEMIIERPGMGAAEAQPSEAAAAPADIIPPQAPFKLVFLFPGAEGTSGMTPEDVLKESGGILLKVRYEVAGKQKSFIQYLPPALLEEQLVELQAEAKGS